MLGTERRGRNSVFWSPNAEGPDCVARSVLCPPHWNSLAWVGTALRPAARLTLLFKRGRFWGEAGRVENAWSGAFRRTRRAIASDFVCLLFLSVKYRVRVLVRIVSKAHASRLGQNGDDEDLSWPSRHRGHGPVLACAKVFILDWGLRIHFSFYCLLLRALP